MKLPRSLSVALQFLTTLPVKVDGEVTPREIGRSLLYYPLVGAAIGALLAGLGLLLADAPGLLAAALLVTAWAGITGALHLDGLADSADALLGGLGDRERSLAIMKDPNAGPMGVTALVLVLLLKCAALVPLLAQGHWALLLAAPVLGRAALVALFLSTPYVRPGGLGAALAEHLPREAARKVLWATGLVLLPIAGLDLLWPLATAAVIFLLLRHLLLRRLGGTTGDTAGALLELVETAALCAAALAV